MCWGFCRCGAVRCGFTTPHCTALFLPNHTEPHRRILKEKKSHRTAPRRTILNGNPTEPHGSNFLKNVTAVRPTCRVFLIKVFDRVRVPYGAVHNGFYRTVPHGTISNRTAPSCPIPGVISTAPHRRILQVYRKPYRASVLLVHTVKSLDIKIPGSPPPTWAASAAPEDHTSEVKLYDTGMTYMLVQEMEHFSASIARSVARADWNCNLSRLRCVRRVLQHSSRGIALHLSASNVNVCQIRCIQPNWKFRRPNENPMDYYSYYLKHYYYWLYCVYEVYAL